MSEFLAKRCTAFSGYRLLATGPLIEVVFAVKEVIDRDPTSSLLVFEDATGSVVDLDLRGSKSDIVARLTARDTHAARDVKKRQSPVTDEGTTSEPLRRRGRPALGVVAREVTLLPRHWEWLAQQKGGASVALRRLVDEARRADGGQSGMRERQEATYRFMSAIAGDFPRFEEAVRALFAGHIGRIEKLTEAWPVDVRVHTLKLAGSPLECQ